MHKGKSSDDRRNRELSFHFKDLHEAEELAEVHHDKLTFGINDDSNSNIGCTDVGGSAVPISVKHLSFEELEIAQSADKNERFLWKTGRSAIKDNMSSTGCNQTDNKSLSVKPRIYSKPIVPSNAFFRSENVKEHPLAGNSSSSDDDLDHQKKSTLPATSVSHHQTEARVHPETPFSKGMLSSAIFNSKARTQLITTLKKNIQQYTNLAQSATKNPSDDNMTRADDRLRSPYNPKNDSIKAEILERKRFPSDADFILHPKISDADTTGLQMVKPENTILKSSSATTVSLSTLLTEHQESQDAALSLISQNTNVERIRSGGQSHMILQPSPAIPVQAIERKRADSKRDVADAMTNISKFSCTIYALYMTSTIVYLYKVLPLPLTMHFIFFSFIVGAITTVCVLCIFTSPEKQMFAIRPPYTTQNITCSSQIPKLLFNPSQAFRGWMNQIKTYNIESYHISATSSVFVTLEGSTLRLQTPRRNIPRRASHGERSVQVSNVISQRLYDLSKAKVYLVPSDLVKKRVWSKKYPICIEMVHSAGSDINSETHAGTDENKEISPDDASEKIYLFGRTQPQKEQWFYRFQRVITLARKELDSCHISVKENESTETKTGEFNASDDRNLESSEPTKLYQKYYGYMCRLLPDVAMSTPEVSLNRHAGRADFDPSQSTQFSTIASHSESISEVVTSQPTPLLRIPDQSEPGLNVAWFNVIVGRIMFDFLRLHKWAEWVSSKIQKKLEKIKLPYFMEGLRLTEMDLGKTVPLVHKISLPRLDAEGVWLEMDITYNGSVQMTLETKMVLTRLGKQQSGSIRLERMSAALNSDEEDSAESSEDEESILASSLPAYVQHFVPKGSDNLPLDGSRNSTSPKPSHFQEKRWVRIVDSITKSKYFQRVTETNYIKKKLETVSNIPLVLTAELIQCQGTICINIPPPPSDRIWYGFKDKPNMVIKARPKLGERVVTIVPITDWIEKRLLQEFNKVVLMPNMDDIPVPIMFNNLSLHA